MDRIVIDNELIIDQGNKESPMKENELTLEKMWPIFLEWINDYVEPADAAKCHYSREDMRYAFQAGYEFNTRSGLENLEVVEICEHCRLQWQGDKEDDNSGNCKYCRGNGKATRAATIEDVVSALLILMKPLSKIDKGFETQSGGILRIKGE